MPKLENILNFCAKLYSTKLKEGFKIMSIVNEDKNILLAGEFKIEHF